MERKKPHVTAELIDELRQIDRVIYYLPQAGEDDFWMSTAELADVLERSMRSVHARLVSYRNQGIVEQYRERSPKRVGTDRYFLDHDGARWRLRQPEAEQENQFSFDRMKKQQDQLTTEAHMVLDATMHFAVYEILSWKTGLQASEIKGALKEIRQALGREV